MSLYKRNGGTWVTAVLQSKGGGAFAQRTVYRRANGTWVQVSP